MQKIESEHKLPSVPGLTPTVKKKKPTTLKVSSINVNQSIPRDPNRSTMSSTSRRMFRGRSGPTDRNLPKHQARRRRHHQAMPTEPCAKASADNVSEPFIESVSVVVEDDLVDSDEAYSSAELSLKNEDSLDPETNESAVEINHFQTRVKNNRRALCQSKALSNPVTYRTNVLNATKNCVVEWQAILRQHKDIPEDVLSSVSLGLFELIQQSLQSGPLKGAKPGYFKRCGSETAAVVLEFLEQICPNKDAAAEMFFSEKQVAALSKWQSNARAATKAQKPPSKSVLKQESLAKKRAESKIAQRKSK